MRNEAGYCDDEIKTVTCCDDCKYWEILPLAVRGVTVDDVLAMGSYNIGLCTRGEYPLITEGGSCCRGDVDAWIALQKATMKLVWACGGGYERGGR